MHLYFCLYVSTAHATRAAASGSSHEDGFSNEQISFICGVTQCTPEQAIFYLEASNGDSEGAVNMFYGIYLNILSSYFLSHIAVACLLPSLSRSTQRDHCAGEEHRDGDEGHVEEPYAQEQGLNENRASPSNGHSLPPRRWLHPLQLLQNGFSYAFRTAQRTSSAIGNIGVVVLPRSLLQGIQGKDPLRTYLLQRTPHVSICPWKGTQCLT